MKVNASGLSTKRKSFASSSKIKNNKEWEDLPPVGEEDFFSEKDFEHLLSLEVLTDYHLAEDGKLSYSGSTGLRKKEVAGGKKRKITETEEALGEDNYGRMTRNKNKKIKSVTRLIEDATEREIQGDEVSSKRPWTVVDMVELKDGDNDISDQTKPKKKSKTKKSTASKTTKSVHTEEYSPSLTFNLEAWSKLGVREVIVRALSEAKFDYPTPIQNMTLGASILGKKDIVGAAETGSGKTLAFAIPILQGILEDKEKCKSSDDSTKDEGNLQALILTPTRELALQIKKHMDVVSKYTNIKVVVIVGGLAAQKQERMLRMKPEVVIATIGRFSEMVQNGNLYLSALNKIRYLAVDETDRMVEKGHFQELEGILRALNTEQEYQKRRQNFVFSATLAFTHEPISRPRVFKKGKRGIEKKKVSPQEKLREIMTMVGIDEGRAKIVDITSGKGTCETLVEMSLTCQLNQKDVYLYYFFLTHPGRTIVFCNSINCVRRLVNLFYLLKLEPLALHSEMVQKQRLRSLERFTSNEKGILIATDVAARGLDITNIQHVIHYQVPKTAESYIHRSGRTARAFKGGLALVLIEPAETSNFWNISRSLGRQELLPTFPVDGQLLHQIKAQIDLGIKVEKLEHQVRKKSADINWIEKAKKDMDLASSDEDSDTNGKRTTKKNMKKSKVELENWKEQLDKLIASNSTVFLKQNTRVSDAFNKIIAGGTGVEK